MADGEQTGFREVSASVSEAVQVPEEEEEKNEDTESGNSDASVGPAVQTAPVGLNEAPAPQYDLIVDLLHTDMFKVLSDMLRSETLLIQRASQQSSDICR